MAIDRDATARRRRVLTAEELERLRARIDPKATRIGARPLVGGLDTATYRLTLERGTATTDVVVRIYREYEHDAAEAVRREFAALTAVSAATMLAPTPILADASGAVIGDPLIVISFFPGAPLPPRADADEWVQQMADGSSPSTRPRSTSCRRTSGAGKRRPSASLASSAVRRWRPTRYGTRSRPSCRAPPKA